MNGKHTGPIINSRHNGNLPKSSKAVFIVPVVILVLLIASGLFFVVENEPVKSDFAEESLYDEDLLDTQSVTGDVEEIIAGIEKKMNTKEEGTVDFFYQRALQKENDKDYQGAVDDYTKTIEKATRYSAEMWNALNNRGIINAKQFKNYKVALTDFNKIIEIETNRRDGKTNTIRLEAGYTNRAYVKKLKGDKEGACDDLYEALALGVPESAKFIEKQINKNCN